MSKKVFVGLSGGVDSSVAALRLIKQGYNVTGVFIKVWHPDFLVCNWEQERLDAMRVAATLNIPFLTCDAEEAYKRDVADYFINEYKDGRTPNPDVMCNKYVKFGHFLNFALENGADYIATGHYAQKLNEKSMSLYRGLDENKDQSYFLWTLTNEQMTKVLFPVGDSIKEVIRQEAKAAGLPTAEKHDSQGICFLGHIDIADFLSHYVTLLPGEVLNTKGSVIGTHKGSLVYTLGQRHGFDVNVASANRSAYFVVGKDIERNTITVSDELRRQPSRTKITLNEIVVRETLCVGDHVEVQSRYRQKPFTATIDYISDESVVITPTEQFEAIAFGQSVVLYQANLCLGGGIICECM